jgi:lipopolysaccharide/colanic/teichoic acid biosynthesis glycosyltransferase
MRRLRQFAVGLAPIVVVLALGELHAHLIGHYPFTGTQRFAWTTGYVLLLEGFAYIAGVLDDERSTVGVLWSAIVAAFGGALAISLIQLTLGSLLLPREVVFGSALILFPFYVVMGLISQPSWREGGDRILAVVAPDEGLALEADFRRAPERPGHLVDVLDPAAVAATTAASPGERGLELVDAAGKLRATVVVLGREALADESIVAQAAMLHGRGIRVRTLALFYDQWLGKLPIADLERISLMFDIQELHTRSYARLKRVVDLVTAVIGLVALAIAIPLVWLADQFGNRGPLFYRQVRTGKGGQPFTIHKFRTMPPTTGLSEWTRESDPRLGAVGRWMRRLHLDELPQSVNILRGELSLVGPRPEQPRYVDELVEKIPYYDVRHLVLPGVTGWAQVKFGYAAGVEDALEKLQYEFFYLRHQGPVLDARILARTLRSIVRAEGR